MPHIHLQTTANLGEIGDVLVRLVGILAGFETIDSKAIKAYHSSREVWVMGEGACPGFIHCEVGLLTGRSLALRQSIGVAFERELQSVFSKSIGLGLAKITVEIREMDIDTYRR
jgi:5-carboxymethyl-2-hydroxymuconate isomerase